MRHYHMVYTADGSAVEKLIATEGHGFFLVEDPATVRKFAHRIGEVTVYDRPHCTA